MEKKKQEKPEQASHNSGSHCLTTVTLNLLPCLLSGSGGKHLTLTPSEIFSATDINHFGEIAKTLGGSAFVPITRNRIKIAIMTTTPLRKSIPNT